MLSRADATRFQATFTVNGGAPQVVTDPGAYRELVNTVNPKTGHTFRREYELGAAEHRAMPAAIAQFTHRPASPSEKAFLGLAVTFGAVHPTITEWLCRENTLPRPTTRQATELLPHDPSLPGVVVSRARGDKWWVFVEAEGRFYEAPQALLSTLADPALVSQTEAAA